MKPIRWIAMVLLCIAPMGCGDDDNGVDAAPIMDAPIVDDAPTADGAPTADAPATADGATDDGAAAAVQVVDCAQVTPDETVTMMNIAYSPANLTISEGDIVQWVNGEQVPHTVTDGNPGEAGAGDLFDSGTMTNAATYCLQFNEAGAYEYYCTIHPTMQGQVTVQ